MMFIILLEQFLSGLEVKCRGRGRALAAAQYLGEKGRCYRSTQERNREAPCATTEVVIL